MIGLNLKERTDMLRKLFDYISEKRFQKQLGSYYNRKIQEELDYEHLSPTTSSVHCGKPFSGRDCEYSAWKDEPSFVKFGHNYTV